MRIVMNGYAYRGTVHIDPPSAPFAVMAQPESGWGSALVGYGHTLDLALKDLKIKFDAAQKEAKP